MLIYGFLIVFAVLYILVAIPYLRRLNRTTGATTNPGRRAFPGALPALAILLPARVSAAVLARSWTLIAPVKRRLKRESLPPSWLWPTSWTQLSSD